MESIALKCSTTKDHRQKTELRIMCGTRLANDGRTNAHGMPAFLQLVLIANEYSNVFRAREAILFYINLGMYRADAFFISPGLQAILQKHID